MLSLSRKLYTYTDQSTHMRTVDTPLHRQTSTIAHSCVCPETTLVLLLLSEYFKV
jgi:hypothetical protein